MKKRIACLVLAMVLLIGLFPVSTLRVSADSLSVSEAGIKVIKEFQGFKKKAYLSGEVYLIGYGTPSKKDATITEANADVQLREALKDIDTQVRNDTAAAGLNLVQKQHDALVWYGFVYGTSNIAAGLAAYGPSISSSQVANVICTYDYMTAGYPDTASAKKAIENRMAMANLFVNGVYSATNKGSFAMTVFDAGNGSFGSAKKMVQVYDTKYTNEISVPNPTLAGKEFLGWYSKNADKTYALVTGLNSATSGKILYARWQEGDTKVKANYTIPAEVLYRAANVPTGDELAVYDKVDVAANIKKIDFVKRNSMVTVVAEQLFNNEKWVELKNSGWVKLGLLSEIKPIVPAVSVTVLEDYVNIRDDASVTANKVGVAKRGETLTVYMTDDLTTNEWGYVGNGWVYLMYTDYASKAEQSAEQPVVTEATVYTGTVVCGSVLNVRQSASASSARVGTINNGSKVEITKMTTTAGHKWGKLKNGGWVCMDYVKLDSTPAQNTSSSTATTGATGVVTGCENLTVRVAPGVSNTKVMALPQGTNVVVYEQKQVDGASWGRIDQGWVALDYVKLNGSIPSGNPQTSGSCEAVVSSTVSLNVRSGPGSEYGKVDSLAPGTKVTVYERTTVSGVTWGRIGSSRWVNMSYVTIQSNSSTGTYSVGGTIVKCSKAANIRAAAGTTNALVGTAALGSRVNVTAKSVVNGIAWYQTERGWICGDYIQLDAEFNAPKPDDQPTKPEPVVDSDITAPASAGYPAVTNASVEMYSSTEANKSYQMTINASTDITILERKMVGDKIYGKVTIGTTTGWVDMSKVTLKTLYGIINVSSADGYEKPSFRAKTEYSIIKGTDVTVTEQFFDGNYLWGKLTHNGVSLWIDMAGFRMYADNKKPAGIFTQNGNGYLTGSINKNNVEIYENKNGAPGAALSYTLVSGYRVNVSSRMYNTATAETWGKIVVNNAACWVNMSNVNLDRIELKTTTAMDAFTDYTGTTKAAALKKGDVLTVLERKVQPFGITVNDWGKVYVNDDPADVRFVILDEGKLTTVTKAPTDGGVSTSILTGIIVVGKADKNPTNVYEEANSASKVLINIKYYTDVAVLNWKNYNGSTWGKVQIGDVTGWVLISDLDFTDLSGYVNVAKLSIYAKPDTSSFKEILNSNNAYVFIKELSFDGKILWGKVSIAGHEGWIDLANVKLNAPSAPAAEAVIVSGSLNSVSSNVTVYADFGVTPGAITLPMGTKVNLLDVKMSGGKAWWKADLGDNDGWIEQEYITFNPATATVTGASSIEVYNDLANKSTVLETIYTGEKVTVNAFKVYTGELYAQVTVKNSIGWMLLLDASNNCKVSLVPGAVPAKPEEKPAEEQKTEPVAAEGKPAYISCNTAVNVRADANPTAAVVTRLNNGTAVTVYEQTTYLNKDWARTEYGWICMDYVKFGTNTSSASASEPVLMTSVPTAAIAVGFANEDVKIRTGAGLGFAEVGTVKKNNAVIIYERKLEGGMSWGRTDKGWVCISYLTITAIGNSGSGKMGTIASSGFSANVRNTAGIGGALVAKAMVTSRVVILDQTEVSGELWGKTDLGWINMQYVVLDSANTNQAPTDPNATDIG